MKRQLLISLISMIALSCSDKSYFSGRKNVSGMVPGFIISNSGDTIQGSIIDQAHHTTHISFISTTGNALLCEPDQIRGYKAGNVCFKSLKLDCGNKKRGCAVYTFGEEITQGILVLYKTHLKTDAFLPATEAYIVLKANNDKVFPAGSIYNLVQVVSDDTLLTKRIRAHEYKDNKANRLAIVNEYNSRH